MDSETSVSNLRQRIEDLEGQIRVHEKVNDARIEKEREALRAVKRVEWYQSENATLREKQRQHDQDLKLRDIQIRSLGRQLEQRNEGWLSRKVRRQKAALTILQQKNENLGLRMARVVEQAALHNAMTQIMAKSAADRVHLPSETKREKKRRKEYRTLEDKARQVEKIIGAPIDRSQATPPGVFAIKCPTGGDHHHFYQVNDKGDLREVELNVSKSFGINGVHNGQPFNIEAQTLPELFLKLSSLEEQGRISHDFRLEIEQRIKENNPDGSL